MCNNYLSVSGELGAVIARGIQLLCDGGDSVVQPPLDFVQLSAQQFQHVFDAGVPVAVVTLDEAHLARRQRAVATVQHQATVGVTLARGGRHQSDFDQVLQFFWPLCSANRYRATAVATTTNRLRFDGRSTGGRSTGPLSAFCYIVCSASWQFSLSVPVQVIDWKDSSPK